MRISDWSSDVCSSDLGSPFSGDLRANHAWRIYELVARHRIDSPPLPVKLTEKPPVPTYAIWSGNDGVVAAHCARGLPEESDAAFEVRCGHMGYMTSRDSIADRKSTRLNSSH